MPAHPPHPPPPLPPSKTRSNLATRESKTPPAALGTARSTACAPSFLYHRAALVFNTQPNYSSGKVMGPSTASKSIRQLLASGRKIPGMIRNKVFSVLIACFALATLANCYKSQAPLSLTMPGLKVHIGLASEPSTLAITISNTHQTCPVTILTWDAPFERSSRDSGVYHVQSTETDSKELKSLGIKIKRKLPAPRTALLEIPAGGQVIKMLEMRSSWIPTDGGRYKIWAIGPWRAVWAKGIEDITEADLSYLEVEAGINAQFETNIIELVLE